MSTMEITAFPREEVVLPHATMMLRRSQGSTDSAKDRLGVFIHGLGGSSLNWTELMHEMQPAMSGIAVDLPGFGMSPPPRDGDVSPRAHAQRIAYLLDSLGEGPVDVFGNSLGGAVAVQLAARYPQLIRSLTLVSPALPSLYATRGNVHLPAIALPGLGEKMMEKYLELPPEQRIKATVDTTFADAGRLKPERMADAVSELEEREGLPYVTDIYLRSLRSLLATYLERGPERPWKLAERITAPTLLIYGRKDPLVDSRSAHRATKAFRHAHVVVLPDSGHVAQMEHPEFVVAAWHRFLSQS